MIYFLLLIFLLFFAWERLNPAWYLPPVKTWPLRVLSINACQLLIVLLAGISWEKWLGAASVFQLAGSMSPLAGGLLAYVVASFVYYWWHRARHRFHALWVCFHQIHHSPRRIEAITSFYKHPADMVVNSFISTLIVYTLLGLSPADGVVFSLITTAVEMFAHTNVRTPHWIGYVIQRPEMHRIHHQSGYHTNNFCELVWWDMLFQTYENPNTWDAECGFTPEREERLMDMIAGKDVHHVDTD